MDLANRLYQEFYKTASPRRRIPPTVPVEILGVGALTDLALSKDCRKRKNWLPGLESYGFGLQRHKREKLVMHVPVPWGRGNLVRDLILCRWLRDSGVDKYTFDPIAQ